MKKIFNTNIRDDKLIELRQIALEEGIETNDMIEKLVSEYIERKIRTYNLLLL